MQSLFDQSDPKTFLIIRQNRGVAGTFRRGASIVKKNILTPCLAILFLILSTFTNQVFGEEEKKTMHYDGIVHEISVDKQTIVVGREDRNIALLFDTSKTTFTNVKGLEDLKQGDTVGIEYEAVRGKTFAVTLTKE